MLYDTWWNNCFIVAFTCLCLWIFFSFYQVLRALKHSLQPVVENISLNWNLPSGLSAEMLSPEQTSLFRGQRLIIYAQLSGTMLVSFPSCSFCHSWLPWQFQQSWYYTWISESWPKPTYHIPCHFRLLASQDSRCLVQNLSRWCRGAIPVPTLLLAICALHYSFI